MPSNILRLPGGDQPVTPEAILAVLERDDIIGAGWCADGFLAECLGGDTPTRRKAVVQALYVLDGRELIDLYFNGETAYAAAWGVME